MSASVTVLKALAVTAELTGTQLSQGGAKVMASDLSDYPETQVLGALARCRKELRGRLTVADVVSRLEDGRPGPEEAWAMLPFDENQTIVWTEEMAGAWGVALPLISDGDRIAARMAFLETYRSRVAKARDAGICVRWTVSLGHDPRQRAAALEQAARAGRLSADQVMRLIIDHTEAPTVAPDVAAFLSGTIKLTAEEGE
jgi:hypothetical protein